MGSEPHNPTPVEVSVIVPTYREAANVAELADRLFAALGEQADRTELILVDDDSGDGIERVVAASAHRDRIRLLVRRGERGLASAVLHGMAHAAGRWIVVMDADLSHPPELAGELVAAVRDGRAEMALGSRYAPGATTDERWGLRRRLNSQFATLLARPFARVTDPMSGFFAISRAVLGRADHLNPIGYKIALELMVKCRCERVVEVPIHFADRRRGRSKLTFGEQLRYVEHLSRLYDFKFPRLSPVVKFLIVTLAGALGGCLWIACGRAGGAVGRGWLLAAYWPAVAINLLAYWRYVKQMKGRVPIRRPKAEFAIISAFEWMTYALAVYGWLGEGAQAAGASWIAAAWLWFAAAFVTRFVLRKLAGHDIRGLPSRIAVDAEERTDRKGTG